MKAGGTVVAFEVKGRIGAGRQFFELHKLFIAFCKLGDTRQYCYAPSNPTTHS